MKNKNIKILFFTLLIFLGILFINTKSKANSINSIDMKIYLDNSGNATVTETWDCYVNSGTEVYHPYYNLGNSQITDLTVTEGTTKYTTLSSWDTTGTLISKAYKAGINKVSNGVELCWGMSSSGSHIYVVNYKISNFVSNLKDSQMIYWTLIPYDFSNKIGNVNIKIYRDTPFVDTTDVWGYGNYGGLCYVSDGSIYMSSDGTLKQDEYMTILVKFPSGTFNATNQLNHDFDYYYKMANEGSKKYNKFWDKLKENFFTIYLVFIYLFLLIILILAIIADISRKTYVKTSFEEIEQVKNAEYFRDIPCDGDLFTAYFVAYSYRIIKKKTDLLGAVILKWLKDDIVKINKIEKNGVLKNTEETTIVFNYENKVKLKNELEQKLFDMMYEASQDGILEKKEFEKWCSGKYNKILNWFDTVLITESFELCSKGTIGTIPGKQSFLQIGKYTSTHEFTEMGKQISGLKKFLLDYTLIKDRESIEVTLFENYLIYAQLLGIAKKVSKEFKDLYPDLIKESHFDSYDDIMFVYYCSNSGISSANSARAAAESYSSGGGGFSSGGGGGGSFGGGGGRRRFPLKFNNL